MTPTCLIVQPAGLGDILFCQKIGFYYYNQGYRIIWPVDEVYLNDVRSYVDSPFNFVPRMALSSREPIFRSDYIYLPLDGCSTIMNDLIMISKMKMARVDYDKDWTDYVKIKRNKEKENELFYNILNLRDGEEYVLVNYNFASPPKVYRQSTRYNGPLKEVEISFLKGFSLFDWSKVIENATEVFITDSSATLLVELLNSSTTKKYTIITRQGNFKELNCMYKLPWTFIKGNIQL
jgi:hypothetical protein